MAIHNVQHEQFARPSPQIIQSTTLPAPSGGMDARQNLASTDPTNCIFSYNMNPAEYGLVLRNGYRQYQTGISGGVKTIIPYNGDESDGGSDRLFATSPDGIWDVTVDGGVPSLVQSFPNNAVGAGQGVYTAFTSDAGTELLFYADRLNGLYQYDPLSDSWTVPTITGVLPVDVNFVMAHKQRIWLGERNSSTGWYLGIGAIAGAATPFYFGSKFKHGGDLIGIYSWTVDGGDGVDDYFVTVSRSGDVIPWRGSDVEAPDWQTVGTYFIGEIPRGNKIGTALGGDLILLSEFGITAMSDMLQGSVARDLSNRSITFKITNLIRNDLRDLKNFDGWELRYLASQGVLLVNVPQRLNSEQIQYVFTRTTEGWCIWRGVPMDCVDTWLGSAIIGTSAGTIERMDSARDGVIDGVSQGNDIEFSLLTAYQYLSQPSVFKRGEFIRPTFIAGLEPSFQTQFLYDFDIRETLPPTTFATTLEDAWDLALWDTGIWSESGIESSYDIRGGLDIGRALAVAIRGFGISDTTLVSVDVMWRQGGLL